jgi:hypothetical protein
LSEEQEMVLVWILVIILIPIVSGIFWHRHGEFMEACMRTGKTFLECWPILR